MIIVFTPVHGRSDITNRCLAAIDAVVPAPFLHFIGDDFSPDSFDDVQGPVYRDGQLVGERIVYHCSDIGCTESPNLGTSLNHVFEQCCNRDFEALLVVESDVILRHGIVEAFREAEQLHGNKCGSVVPIFTEVGCNTIASFGGMMCTKQAGEPQVLGLKWGLEIGSWKQSEPRIDTLWWSHLAACWLPSKTVRKIRPDPAFRLYFVDHDLSYAIRNAGLDIVITDRAVAEHTRGNVSTSIRWPDNSERAAIERTAYQQLKTKWKKYHK